MIEIHTDGACSGNPGPGGWAAIVVENGEKRELYGRESLTTNNRMEMLAVIKGLQATLGGVDVKIYDKEESKSTHSLSEVLLSEFIFLSVPTPSNQDGSINVLDIVALVNVVLAGG